MNDSRYLTVAIVDDDPSLCRSLARLLRAAGIASTSYLSAEAFLADSNHAPFDCLLVDVQLGGIDGIELQEKLLATGSKTPAIFITAHDEPAIQERAMAAGGAAFFRKGDPGADVIRAILEVTDQAA